MIADFDHDGKLDLAFSAHSIDPGHDLDSPIFFNDGHRFKNPRSQYLPAIGPHYMWEQDIGNIYTRHYDEEFTSRILAWPDAHREGGVTINATAPFGAHTEIEVRSAATEAALTSATWRPVSGGAFAVADGDRALQYHLRLVSANGDAYPVVRQVEIRLK
jgi:hypothetical protein